MYGNNRRQMRQPFLDAWKKHLEGRPMTALDHKISEVISQHPEYHELLANPERALEKDWLPENGETNPFLHLGFHLSIREMAQIDQPAGFGRQYRALCHKTGDALNAEHLMMECLSEALWRAQRDGTEPDSDALLHCISAIQP